MKSRLRQSDLFVRQSDLFDNYRQGESPNSMPAAEPVSDIPAPEYVRERMEKILAEAKAASRIPWDDNTARVYEIIFPQMANWLPGEEAQKLLSAFNAELARLKLIT